MADILDWLTKCAICEAEGEFNEEFMDIICPSCADFSNRTIAANVMKFRSENPILEIIKEVEEITGITHEMMLQKTRKREVVEARQVSMAAIKRRTEMTNEVIAWEVGRMDHASVNHARKAVKNLLDTDKKFKIKYKEVLGL